jgi:HEAT repeat protein
MSLLLAALLSLQQSDADLRALVERFNASIREDDPEGKKRPWDEVRRAGPAVVKHLAAAFPGRRLPSTPDCKGMGWEGEREYPLVTLLVFVFKDHALPHLIPLTRDPDPAKARIAAAVLRHFPVKEIVGPLIEYSKSRDLDSDPEVKWTVWDSIARATFLGFKSQDDLETWYGDAKSRTQADWLREAIDHADTTRIVREAALQGMFRLLDPPGRLKALLHCFVDLEWREAGFALYSATGHQLDPKGKVLWDPAIMAKEREAWDAFRKKREWEQQVEIALHCAGTEDATLPGRLMTPAEAADILTLHAADAFDHLEDMTANHPHCARQLYTSLHCVATATNWERVAKLAPKLNPQFAHINQIMERSRHPSMTDKMFDMVLAGAVERGPFRILMTEFPRRARRDMVPKILESLETATHRTRETLLAALAAVGDPRGWDILQAEIFSDPVRISQTVEMLEGFPGDEAAKELRRILDDPRFVVGANAARILADRGDLSGVPVLIRALDHSGKNETTVALLCLSQIRGRWPAKEGKPLEPWPGTEAIADFKAWWERNKSRSRMEWLLEDLEEGAESGTPWGVISNPLALLAKQELKDISKDQHEQAYRKAVAARVRAWVAKTGYTFTKDSVRIPYWPWREKDRR